MATDEVEHLLCIGGHKDGETLPIRRDRRLVTHYFTTYETAALVTGQPAWCYVKASITTETYVRKTWCHGNEPPTFRDVLVPVDQRPEEALEMVLDRYGARCWRPIATAPKDGSWFDAWDGETRLAWVQWSDDDDCGHFRQRCAEADSTFRVHDLTHWMPIPPGPGAA